MINISDSNFSFVENINKIVAILYEDDLPLPTRIVNFYNMVIDLIYFDKASIIFFTKSANSVYEKHSSISINWDQEYVKQHYDDFYCHIDDTLAVLDQSSPIIFRGSTFFNQAIRSETQYWKEYLSPNNCIYSLEGNIKIKSSKGIKGGFCFYRGKNKADFTEEDMRIMKLFQPHLSNIFKNFGEEPDSSGIIFMLNNYNYIGLGTMDKKLNLLRSNDCFQRFITAKNGIDVTNKINDLCKELKNSNSSKISTEYKFAETPIFLEVSQVPKEIETEFRFSCMIYDISHFFNHTLIQAKEKYMLTKREFEVIQAVLKGRSNEEIGAELFLSLATVKKYLSSIYSKMEIKNQKQILEKLKII